MFVGSSKDLCEIESQDKDEVMTDFSFLLMECLRLLIESNSDNAMFFRQFRGAECAHSLIPFGCARPYALKIIQQLIVDGGHDDLGMICILFFQNQLQLIISISIYKTFWAIFSLYFLCSNIPLFCYIIILVSQ